MTANFLIFIASVVYFLFNFLLFSEIVCPDPFIMNTDMLHNDTSYGGLVSYTCAAGYKHVSGDLRRTCVGNGSWNGTEPLCKGVYLQCDLQIHI